jgi:O-antigen ligase
MTVKYKYKTISLIMLVLVVVGIPYVKLFQDYANTIILMLALIYIVFFVKRFNFEKVTFCCLIGILIFAIFHVFDNNSFMESIQNLSIYGTAAVFYIIFMDARDQQEFLLKVVVYAVTFNAIYYSVVQGGLFNGGVQEFQRIDGNLGYPNAYAVVLLAALYFNRLRKEEWTTYIVYVVLGCSIFYTGSRAMLIFLAVFMLFTVIYNYRNLKPILSVGIGFLIYILLIKAKVAVIAFVPFIFGAVGLAVYKVKTKYINIFTLVFLAFCAVAVFAIDTPILDRLRIASGDNQSMQNRLFMWKDTLAYAKQHIWGSGLGIFRYRHGLFQTVFYDTRYAHQSVLQLVLDIGLVPAILFTMFFISTVFSIYKTNKDKSKWVYVLCFSSIFLHSLMDFEFAYSIVVMLYVLNVTAIESSHLKEMPVNRKLIAAVLIISIYSSALATFDFMGVSALKAKKLSKAYSYFSMERVMSFKDYLPYKNLGELYREKFIQTRDKQYIDKAIENYEKAWSLNKESDLLMYGMMNAYEYKGNVDKAFYIGKELIKQNPLDVQVYSMYEEYINMLLKTNNEKFVSRANEEKQWMEEAKQKAE